MKNLIFTVIIIFAVTFAKAQTETFRIEETGYLPTGIASSDGKVYINQSVYLNQLIKKQISSNDNKFPGWRVQIYFGAGQNAKYQSSKSKEKFMYKYGNKYGAYIVYNAPYFKLRVGDFRTKAEALYFKEKISKTFSSSWVVSDRINYPENN